MQTPYEFGRNIRGDLRARSVYPLGFDRRELHVETSKSSPGLSCRATVFRVTDDGRVLEHAFGLGRPGSGDYRATLAQDRTGRATEKAVRTMHERCTAELAATLAAACAHYGKAAPGADLTAAQVAGMDETMNAPA